MNREIIQRAEAQEDLADAFAYIGQDSLDAAFGSSMPRRRPSSNSP